MFYTAQVYWGGCGFGLFLQLTCFSGDRQNSSYPRKPSLLSNTLLALQIKMRTITKAGIIFFVAGITLQLYAYIQSSTTGLHAGAVSFLAVGMVLEIFSYAIDDKPSNKPK